MAKERLEHQKSYNLENQKYITTKIAITNIIGLS